MLSYASQEVGGVLVFSVEDVPEGEELTSQRQRIYGTIESRPDPRFAIDLGSIRYLMSSDIGFLITLKRRIDARGGKVVLFGVDQFVMEILRTMRLDQHFAIAANLPEALARLAPAAG